MRFRLIRARSIRLMLGALKLGMSKDKVVSLLGEPEQTMNIEGRELWSYPNNGYVVLDGGAVVKWSEPEPAR